jgi:hypothetical protein
VEGQAILTPDELTQIRIHAAERAHDDERDFATAANAAAIKNAEEAIKAVILINGGSSVAMLAFIGTLVSRDFLSPSQIADIAKPLMWFASGVGAGVVTAAAAYFTNLGISGSSSRKKRNYEQPFTEPTPSSLRHAQFGEVFRWVGIAAVIVSMGCFAGGLITAQSAFTSISSAAKPAVVVPPSSGNPPGTDEKPK